jgi:hypothetical protein
MLEIKRADGTFVIYKCVIQLMADHPALKGISLDERGAGAFGRMAGLKPIATAFGVGVGLTYSEVMLLWGREYIEIVEDTDGSVYVGSTEKTLGEMKTSITGLSPEEADLALAAYDRLMGGQRP